MVFSFLVKGCLHSFRQPFHEVVVYLRGRSVGIVGEWVVGGRAGGCSKYM